MKKNNLVYILAASIALFVGYLYWRDQKEKKEGNPPKQKPPIGGGDTTNTGNNSSLECKDEDLDQNLIMSLKNPYMQSCEVKELQKQLNKAKSGSESSPLILDGVFGVQTDTLFKELTNNQLNEVSLFSWSLFNLPIYSGG